MAGVKVLIEGVHRMSAEETVEVFCTTTLIKSDINIVVDPGSFINQNKLIQALKNDNLTPNDIHAVVLTHSHIDHTTNICLFNQAKIYNRLIGGTNYKGQYQEIDKGLVFRYDILNQQITKDVKIIETQGHSIDSITVLVDTKDGVVAISGDAIANKSFSDLNKQPDQNLVYNLDKYIESRKAILAQADWVVPGHGKMFKVKKV